MTLDDPVKLEKLPATYNEVSNYFAQFSDANPYFLRLETFNRIQQITGRPLICYVAKTHRISPKTPVGIDHSDLAGFSDLVQKIDKDMVDVFLVSNGGISEATERIVSLLRGHFKEVRFIIPANAYSAATLMCMAGDEIIMTPRGTLGPIDPQYKGIPARLIQLAFERIEKRIEEKGLIVLAVYLPLIAKYDLTILESCESAQELSKELARKWISQYMLKCPENDERVDKIVRYIADFDLQKSHARSIGRETAKNLGMPVVDVEKYNGLKVLVKSLYTQYEWWFDRTSFYKMFENHHGICWGRQAPKNPPNKEKE